MTLVSNRFRMRHLRCFLAVAEHGSVTNASASLNTSQPALSRSLRELETEVGRALFLRTGRGLALTPAGEAFRRHVGLAMSQIEVAVQLAGGTEPTPAVTVGMLPNVARSLAVSATAMFKEQAPDVDVRLFWSNVPDLINRLHHGQIEIIMGRLLSLEHMPGVSFEHLYSEPLVFVASAGHPLAQLKTVTLEQINQEMVIVPYEGTIIRRELDKFTIAGGLAEFAHKIETVSFEFTRSYLAQHSAVACLPLGAVRTELAAGRLEQLALHGEALVSSVGVTYLSAQRLSTSAASFVAMVRAAASDFE